MPPPGNYDKLSFTDASKALEIQARDDQAKGWHGERAPEVSEPLLEFTTAWIESLPPSLRPVALPRDFPRIANTLAVVWKRPARAERVFPAAAPRSARRTQGFSSRRGDGIVEARHPPRDALPVPALDLGRRPEEMTLRRRPGARATELAGRRPPGPARPAAPADGRAALRLLS